MKTADVPVRDLRSRRYAELVRQLGVELGPNMKYGWKKLVAEKLGVHPSYVTKISGGDFGAVGDTAVLDAIRRLSLSPDFFTAKTGHYKDFISPTVEVERHDLLGSIVNRALELGCLGKQPPGSTKEIPVREAREFAFAVAEWARDEIQLVQRARDAAVKAVAAPDDELLRIVSNLVSLVGFISYGGTSLRKGAFTSHTPEGDELTA